MLVWKISLNSGKQNARKENCLLDAYVDADTGKVYEFYVRVPAISWEQVSSIWGSLIKLTYYLYPGFIIFPS